MRTPVLNILPVNGKILRTGGGGGGGGGRGN